MTTRIVPSYETYEFDEKKNLYCICVFVINEGEKLLKQLKTMSGICDGLVDIVVADGGSTDGSTDHENLKQLGVNTLLVKTGKGKLGSQMRMAFDWALNRGYEGVIVVDGNGKDGMDAIPHFVDELKKGVDHVQGSRFIKGGHHENTPKSRLWGLKLLHVPLMRLASGFKYTDTTNGFRAYSARLLSSDELNIFRNCFAGYELHYYLAIEAARQGFHCSEIPVSRVYPAEGTLPTKISGFKGNVNVLFKLMISCLHVYVPPKAMLRYINTLFIIIISIVFGCYAYQSYYSNKYKVVEEKKFENWQQDSERHVRNRIDPEKRQDIKWYSLHHMGSHYIGGQAIADSYICHFIEDSPFDNKVDLLHKTEVLLTVILLSYLCYWIGTELSFLASILFALCAVQCQFMVISTRNLYWSMWTMYFPIVFCLYVLRNNERSFSKKNIIPSYLSVVGLTLFVRFVTVFEYSSSAMVLVELPLLYYAAKNKWSTKKYLLNAFWTGIIAIAVFLFSYLILFFQMLAYRANWVFSKGWEYATANVRYRTGVGADNQADVFIKSFLPDLESIFEEYLNLPAFIIDYTEYKVSTIICWAFVLFFIGVLTAFFAKKMNVYRKLIAFGSIAFLSTLMQFVWIVTAKGHSAIHVQINYVLWNIPLLLMSALIGYIVSRLIVLAYMNITLFRKKTYTSILSCAIILGISAFSYLYYKSNYSGFEIMLKRFENAGISIPDKDIQYLIFPDEKILFFKLPNNLAETNKFFYVIYPLYEDDITLNPRKDYKYNNLGFSIKNRKDKALVPKPLFSNSQYEIVQCQLPQYQYVKIEIGQFDDLNKKRIWALFLNNEISDIRENKVCNITNQEWTSGVNNSNKKCILFLNTQTILPGDYVSFPDKSLSLVEKVEVHGKYLRVFLDKETPSFNPNRPIVFSKKKPDSVSVNEKNMEKDFSAKKTTETKILPEVTSTHPEVKSHTEETIASPNTKNTEEKQNGTKHAPFAIPVVAQDMMDEADKDNEEPFFSLYENKRIETLVLQGTVREVSNIPDPDKNDYPNALYSVFVELNSILVDNEAAKDLASEAIITVPILKNNQIIESNIFLPGDKISCKCAGYDAMPQAIQEIQVSDDIQVIDYQWFYALVINKIDTFSGTGKKTFGKRVINIHSISQLPKDENARLLRTERIQTEINRIENELKKHGGSFLSWKEEYKPISDKYKKLCDEGYKEWIGDSYFSANGKETTYNTQAYIDWILPYKKYLDDNNIDLIVLRYPSRSDFAARVLAANEFQENPAWVEHYYTCLKNDIEIVDPMPEMYKKRFDYPLFYFYASEDDAHPLEGYLIVAAEKLSQVLSRYKYEQNRSFEFQKVVVNGSKLFLYPEGHSSFSHNAPVEFDGLSEKGKIIGPLQVNTGSPFLFLSNSLFGYRDLQKRGSSVPHYTSFFLHTIVDWKFQNGINNAMLRNLLTASENLDRRRAVIFIGQFNMWGSGPQMPKYFHDNPSKIFFESKYNFLSNEIAITDVDSCTLSTGEDGVLLFTRDEQKAPQTFTVEIPVSFPDCKYKTCMIRINFNDIRGSIHLTASTLAGKQDSSSLTSNSDLNADLFVPVTDERIRLSFVCYSQSFTIENIELWYY